MLVLTRKTNESIFIDGEIEVMVVAVRGNRVRLGFRAPAEVTIQRKERATAPPSQPRDAPTRSDQPAGAAAAPLRHSRTRTSV
jgi:carbon storage regulator CsrA